MLPRGMLEAAVFWDGGHQSAGVLWESCPGPDGRRADQKGLLRGMFEATVFWSGGHQKDGAVSESWPKPHDKRAEQEVPP